ncbi:DUF4113 domain-containing protein [Photorhabdus tasmaniensis]
MHLSACSRAIPQLYMCMLSPRYITRWNELLVVKA